MLHIPTGQLNIQNTDFELPGIIPFEWKRNNQSWVTYNKSDLGTIWTHNFDQYLELVVHEQYINWKKNNGSIVSIPYVEDGEENVFKDEKISYQRKGNQIILENYEEDLWYVFTKDNFLGNNHYKLTNVQKYQFSIDLNYTNGMLALITDTANREITFLRNENNLIVQVQVLAEGKMHTLVSYEYDEENRLTSVTNSEGITEQYEYNNNFLTKKIDGNGSVFYWQYENKTDEPKCIKRGFTDGTSVEKFTYEKGITKITDGKGNTTTYYINDEKIVQVQNPLGHSEYWEYDLNDNLICYTDALGQNTYYGYDVYGNQTHIRLPNGAELLYTYENNKLTSVTNAMGAVMLLEYNEIGQLVTQIGYTNDITRYEYENNLLTTVINPNGLRTYISYTKNYQLNTITDHNKVVTEWKYDELGRVLTIKNSENIAENYRYDSLGRVTSIVTMEANRINLKYDALGNLIQLKDAQHNINFKYNSAGKLLSRKQNNTEILFKYDRADNLKAIVNEEKNVYSFKRNAAGHIVKEIGFDGKTQRYLTNPVGNVVEKIDPLGVSTKITYDRLGKVSEVVYPSGDKETYQYDKNGLLVQAINKNATVVFKRDETGNIITETQNGIEVKSTYNAMGYRTHLESSLGANIAITRNKDNSIANTVAKTEEASWQAQYTYDALGLEIERNLPGGVTNTWQRRPDGKPEVHAISVNEKQTTHRRYSWDINDKLTRIFDNIANKGVAFSYDAFNNLAKAGYSDGSFDYKLPDAVGNLYQTEAQNERTYGKAGQLLSCPDFEYNYDVNGNLVEKRAKKSVEVWRYTWEENGMLFQVIQPNKDVISFTYDALGRRISKQYNDQKITYWVYDKNVPLHEWSLSDKEDLVTWIFEEDSFVPQAKIQNNETYSIITDHLGTPIQAYHSSGKKVWECELDIYGKARSFTGEKTFIPFRRYQGQYEDEETGLYYNRFRYYSSESGTYISQDPIRLAGGTALYAYTHDSNMWIDPLGLAVQMVDGMKMGDWGEKVASKYLAKNGHSILGSVQNASGHGFDLVTKTAKGDINIIEVKTSQSKWRSKRNMPKWTNNNIGKIQGNTNGFWGNKPKYQDDLMRTIRDAKSKGKLRNKLFQINIDKRSVKLKCK
eukprot:TRINITY_DN209_c0_g2_i1.p1 TRINITY_DN209_c0_g2~~TRINITY_DN209_c0_g2_i1.p1  ORF type:complete len:1124 (+),score=185.96 TRINITY_DN209_c0_g2_i1:4478-7849(+)